MANNHGGARPGAGRKKKADTFASEIQAAERQIADRLPSLISNMMTLADGVAVLDEREETEDGEEKEGGRQIIYVTPPNRSANEYLINRILGRPTQAVELSGPDGDAVPVALEALSIDGLKRLRTVARELASLRPGRGAEQD